MRPSRGSGGYDHDRTRQPARCLVIGAGFVGGAIADALAFPDFRFRAWEDGVAALVLPSASR